MKTLKKTLCLVLAVVLAVGVLVIPANADKATWDGFTDKKTVDIKYQEAVGALTGLGAINGRGNEVQADKYVTRAEAVTMLVSAALGQDAVKVLPVRDTKFADVTKAHFAAKFVDYAVQEGIVAGKTDTTFAPNEFVTGYELAKMALVAADIVTAFDPSNWQITTAVEAQKAGLLIGLENITDLNKALTRQEAAQLLWNMVTYLPESVTLDVLTVENNDTTLTYKVTFPEESIGGAVYNLAAIYNYDKDDVPGDPNAQTWDEDYGYPSVKWYNAETEEVYYAGAVSGLVSFTFGDGAASTLTVADLKTKLNITAAGGIDAAVYIDGFTNDAAKVLHAGDDVTTPVTGNASDRGASVVIFKAPAWYASVKYFVYVNYMYAAYSATEAANFTTTSTTTGGFVTDPYELGKLAKETVVTFGISQYKDKAVNKKTDGITLEAAQITRRGNDSTQPYFYLNNSTTKTYISAKGIYVGLDGTVQELKFMPSSTNPPATEKNYITVDATRYYNVWMDDAGNVLVLQETTKPAAPGETVTYDNFGYILEFTCKPGVYRDDMMLEKTEEAIVKVLMVNVKTGETGIYEVATEMQTNGVWKTLGVDGKVAVSGIEIKDKVECIGPNSELTATTQAEILHGFVAYKKLAKGWGITPVGKLNAIGSTDQSYVVGTSFDATQSAARVDITDVNGNVTYAYGNNSSVVILLNSPKDDGTRVTSYTAVPQDGYSELKRITTDTTTKYPGEVKGSVTVAGHSIHVGVNALFRIDAKNQIVAAYVFGVKGAATPATPAMDYYVFMKRDDSVQGGGTDFYFLHNGKEEKIHATAEAVTGMTLQLDNHKDAMTVVTVEKNADGTLKNVALIDAKYTESFTCYTFSDDNSGEYFGYIAKGTTGEDFEYLTEGCWIFDSEVTGTDLAKYVVATTDKDDVVTVYYDYDPANLPAGVAYARVALVVITDNA